MENLHKVRWINCRIDGKYDNRTPLILQRCRESTLSASVFWAENLDQGTIFP